jgi:hypothetical protein
MIIPISSTIGNLDEYIICLQAGTTVAEMRGRMLRRAKVTSGSYAFNLIDDLHAAIFVRSLDLKADYKTYFALEYGEFSEYLIQRMRLQRGAVSVIAKEYVVSAGMYYFKPTYVFLCDEYGVKFMRSLMDERSELVA